MLLSPPEFGDIGVGASLLQARGLTEVCSRVTLDNRQRPAHTRAMAEVAGPLGVPREILLDSRGTALRLSWHPDETIAVLSLWREDRCIGTFRAAPADLARIIGYLAEVLAGEASASDSQLSNTA